VGDLHVENFGSWRDQEGRLAWGVNDFDEAYPLPYLNDWIRLLASAQLAAAEAKLAAPAADLLDAFREGYRLSLETGGCPVVLAEEHQSLRDMMSVRLKSPGKFWEKLDKGKEVEPPANIRKLLRNQFPGKVSDVRFTHRSAGLGSLGRHRFAAIARWNGALAAREAKQLAPSAAVFAGWGKKQRLFYAEILQSCKRSHDPFLKVRAGWVFRRLAPDCSRIELDSLDQAKDELRLFRSMGRETANVHLASAGGKGKIKAIQTDLAKRRASSLLGAVDVMVNQTQSDWRRWRKR
jgi:hypothetical protein